MSLNDIEVRILGALVEKEYTTPEAYPLSTNALVTACNQKTSRQPVTNYPQLEIEAALRNLGDKGLASTGRNASERAYKHRHKLGGALDIGRRELAVLAVLMLRGPQTPGELRSRTERYLGPQDLAEVEAALERLAAHRPPLARNRGREAGQSQDRWSHTLSRDPMDSKPRARPAATGTTAPTPTALQELRLELERVKANVEQILKHLGLPLEGEDIS